MAVGMQYNMVIFTHEKDICVHTVGVCMKLQMVIP